MSPRTTKSKPRTLSLPGTTRIISVTVPTGVLASRSQLSCCAALCFFACISKVGFMDGFSFKGWSV